MYEVDVIEGVTLKDILTHGDDRGFFREVIRTSDPFFADGFGQFSHSLVQQGVLKAWHGHVHQTQWTYAACGLLHVAIHDLRPESPTRGRTRQITIGDGQPAVVYRLPAGVVHGYRVMAGPAHVLYVTSGTYDIADEVRVPHDDPSIGYQWPDPSTQR